MFNFQKAYRKQNKITASDLLISLDLPLSLLRYLYSKSSCPSSRNKTIIGKQLRTKLSEFLKAPTAVVASEHTPYLLQEFVEENRSSFDEMGIDSVFIDESGIVMAMNPNQKTVDEDRLRTILANTQFATIPRRVEFYHYLMQFSSPICTRTSNGLGTSTVALS